MKIFSIAKFLSRRLRHETGIEIDQHWLRDPLAHPELDAMSLTELADLPLSPRAFPKERIDCCA